MPVIVADLLLAALMAVAGIIAGWYLRGDNARRKAGQRDREIGHARDVLARLHELATHVAADVGEHSSRVEAINEELAAIPTDETQAVVGVVDKLVRANSRMQQQLASAETRLKDQAQQIESHAAEARTDALTRLPNRRAFDDETARRLAEFQRHGRAFCAIILDVDHFKRFNDAHGHRAGDEVLRGMGKVLRDNARRMDVPARYGGEEFAVVLPQTSIDEAKAVAERVRRAIDETHVRFEGTDLHVTASIGVAEIRGSEDLAALIQRADEAMYAAKSAGRNCTHWHDGRQIHPVLAKKEREATEAIAEAIAEAVPMEPQPEAPPPEAPPPQASPPRVEADAPVAAGPPDDQQATTCDRSVFCATLGRRLAEWKRGGAAPSMVLIRVDDFDNVVRGHAEEGGELVLRTTAQFLYAALREMDLVARYDEDTFAILLPGAQLADTVRVAERLRVAISRCTLPIDGGPLKFTVSVGGAEATDEENTSKLITRAEEALDAARKSGGNCTYFHNGGWSEVAAAVLERIGQYAVDSK